MSLDPRNAQRRSDEDIEILRMVARGYTDERISREVGLSKSSVQRRLHRAAAERGVTSRLTLVLCAIHRGEIELPRDLCGQLEAKQSPPERGIQADRANRTE
jgi:DNA-binding NarL/FixJ family response regulator